MKLIKSIAFFLLSLFVVFPAVSQNVKPAAEEQTEQREFFLVPLLETALSGEVRWRPSWPDGIPPDAFFVREGTGTPRLIELSGEKDTFIFRRDSAGRLLQFPFFYDEKYAQVSVVYSSSGCPQTMNITIKNFTLQEGESGGEEETWRITFPANFLPFGELSPGGSLPPITAMSGDAGFYVFIFESPLFLTETWYDSGGNMIVHCKAPVFSENGAWRVRSMQIHESPVPRIIDYSYDSFGNISEIRFDESSVFAVSRERFPELWRSKDFRYVFYWDNLSVLTSVATAGEDDDWYIEYRYEYVFDSFGNWTKREEAAYRMQFGLLTPQPLYSRGVWNRRILFFEAGVN